MRYELKKKLFQLSCALAFSGVLLLGSSSVCAQEQQTQSEAEQVADNVAIHVATKEKASAPMPLFTNYKGVTIGMSADEVRQKLDRLKDKGDAQDIFVFSDKESAEVYYDTEKKVTAISVNYVGQNNNAPTPETVVGNAVAPKADGSMYQLVRYPEAGYWVAYSRTAGSDPIITVTMQKI